MGRGPRRARARGLARVARGVDISTPVAAPTEENAVAHRILAS
jgi:hypothetical protein